MDQQTVVTIGAVGVAALALLLALSAHRRISKARRSLILLQGEHDRRSIVEAVARYLTEVDRVTDDLKELERRQEELFARLGRSARNLGVRRFDAFEDMGGLMSFSAALVDDHGTGVVITAINGRTESRTYAKPVEAGISNHNLTPEEQEAIAEALGRSAPIDQRR